MQVDNGFIWQWFPINPVPSRLNLVNRSHSLTQRLNCERSWLAGALRAVGGLLPQ
jgi:hypothetical protein